MRVGLELSLLLGGKDIDTCDRSENITSEVHSGRKSGKREELRV